MGVNVGLGADAWGSMGMGVRPGMGVTHRVSPKTEFKIWCPLVNTHQGSQGRSQSAAPQLLFLHCNVDLAAAIAITKLLQLDLVAAIAINSKLLGLCAIASVVPMELLSRCCLLLR